MRHLTTIILLLIAGLLSGLAITHSGGKHWESIFGAPPVGKGEMLFQSELLAQTRQLTLTNSEGGETSFEFINDAWYGVSPWKDRADSEFIRVLIAFSSQLEVQESIPRKGLKLEKFGLRKGRVQVTMKDAEGKTLCSYNIGRPSALHLQVQEEKETVTVPSLFIRQTDKKKRNNIYICANHSAEGIHNLFKNNFERFRDHHPFYFSPKLIDEIRLQSPQGQVILSNNSDGKGWQITKPLTLRTEHETLGKLFNNLAKLNAYNLEERANITLPTAENTNFQMREFSIHFKGAKESITLKTYPPEAGAQYTLATVSNRPDVVFQLPLNETSVVSLPDLDLGVNDLRSKNLVHINGKQLSTIIVRPKNQETVFLKRKPEEEWKIARNDQWSPLNIDTLTNLIQATTQDKIQRFVTDAATELHAYGLDDPLLQIGFVGFNGTGTRLAISRDADRKNIYAHIYGSPKIWQISPDTFSKIATNSWQWRTPSVWHTPKIDIKKIVIEKQNEPNLELKYQFFSETWEASREGKDITAAINPNRANTFLKHLESISTPTWLGPYNPQAAKLIKTPDTTIHIHIKPVDDNGNELAEIVKSIRIASPPNKILHFAKVSTEPATPKSIADEANYFILDPDVVEKLNIDLFQ